MSVNLDLSVVSDRNWTVVQLDDAWGSRPDEPTRHYIGASGIGDECDAYHALSLRGFPGTDPDKPNVLRIFRDGHRIEEDVVSDMRKAGITVYDEDPQTFKQFNHSELGGHVQGNLDGIVDLSTIPRLGIQEWADLEIKSMNEKKWKEFKGKGIKISHPKYYAQMQFNMGLGYDRIVGDDWVPKRTKCMMVAYNKNTSEYWVEIIDYDDFYFNMLVARAERALNERATRVSDKGIDGWPCRFCFKKEACWDMNFDIPRECSKCIHSSPAEDRGWYCNKHDHFAHLPCEDWERWTPLDLPSKEKGKTEDAS